MDDTQNGTPLVTLLIDGVLDLHTFNPRDIGSLIPEYLSLCREKGILEVRIIHGKGTGALRCTVHAILKKISWVIAYRLADADAGGWGATVVSLKPLQNRTP